MKKIAIYLISMLVSLSLFAQWQAIPVTGSSAEITSMFNFGDDLMVGTLGDGIFKTNDNGESWTVISGDLGNMMVNDIRGGGAPTIIWVATQDGAFFTQDHQTYSNCTNPALANNNIRYFWFGDSNSTNAEWAIGTNGGGIFISAEMTGPWTGSSNGLSGDALFVNDISGYSDDEVNYAVAATDDGVFISTDTLVTWTQKNSGLTGDALHVNRIAGLATFLLIATDNGLFFSTDLGDSWEVSIPNEKFNSILLIPSGSGISMWAVGENAYYSPDFVNTYQLDLTGLEGEITCVAQTSTHAFLGTSISEKGINMNGGILKNQLIN